ncbi:hypothetical protein [Spirosoma spitsbergense]|uniref:hypothetical protein n=1 Tax=Spirosoma spitsbergense TaxID=431554 RepID=UPI00037126BF|nr:hypothetical protein [Spirosoma spitsbergense]
MNTVLLAGRFVLVLVIPLLIAITPLALFLYLSQHKSIKQSAGLVGLSAVYSILTGLVTPSLAFWTCAASMGIGEMTNGPGCVTGASSFLVLGYLFTTIMLVVSLVFTMQQLLSQRKRLGY